MRSIEGNRWEAAYWDEYLREFGPVAYVEARYPLRRNPKGRGTMEFTASIIGTRTVNIPLDNLDEEVAAALDNELLGSELEDVSVDEFKPVDDIEVEVKFSGELTVTIDENDIERLARDEVEQALSNVGVDSFDIDSLEQR
jgi:hypothetical protein